MHWYARYKLSQAAPQDDLPASWQFAHPHHDGYLSLPVVYIRMGDLPKDENGQVVPSMNHFRGVREKGVSVYPAYYDPKTDKYIVASGGEIFMATQNEILQRPAYLVTGTEIDNGYDDGEPVLDPATVKVVRKLDPNQIVFEQDPYLSWGGKDFEGDDIPRFRPEHVGMFPNNKPLLTPEELKAREEERQRGQAEYWDAKKRDWEQQMEALRMMAQKLPEYAETIYKQYPQLRPAQ